MWPASQVGIVEMENDGTGCVVVQLLPRQNSEIVCIAWMFPVQLSQVEALVSMLNEPVPLRIQDVTGCHLRV